MDYNTTELAIAVMDYLEDSKFKSGKEAIELFFKDLNDDFFQCESEAFKENVALVKENKEEIIKVIDKKLKI